jgi:hypothetical protein
MNLAVAVYGALLSGMITGICFRSRWFVVICGVGSGAELLYLQWLTNFLVGQAWLHVGTGVGLIVLSATWLRPVQTRHPRHREDEDQAAWFRALRKDDDE